MDTDTDTGADQLLRGFSKASVCETALTLVYGARPSENNGILRAGSIARIRE